MFHILIFMYEKTVSKRKKMGCREEFLGGSQKTEACNHKTTHKP